MKSRSSLKESGHGMSAARASRGRRMGAGLRDACRLVTTASGVRVARRAAWDSPKWSGVSHPNPNLIRGGGGRGGEMPIALAVRFRRLPKPPQPKGEVTMGERCVNNA